MTTQTQSQLAKSYQPAAFENEILARWESSGVFHAEPDDPRPPYCIVIPPPNVTAALHLGHAFNNSLQDVLIRYHRMRGFNTMWMPGTDHAGIATQSVVEKRLIQQGKKRTDYTRDEFVALVQEWKDEYEATITQQLKSLGCSCDWDRQRFTMDDMCTKAVREAFFRLFKEGLIYRGKRLVNWDPLTLTALADDEVEMKEVDGHFWYLRYPLVHPSTNADDPFDCQEVTWSELAARGYPGARKHDDDEVAWVTVATTRPETYLGDTAVAINPKDPRAAALDGLCAQLPLVGRVIPIIQDDYVVLPDPNSSDPKAQFATGFLKVTPAHDTNDYEIGRRHDERIKQNTSGEVIVNVLAPDATISDQHGWTDIGDAHLFVGKSREDARELVVREFEARGLLEATKPYTHSVGHSYRSHVPIEPYLSDQWYVKVSDDSLVGEAQRALSDDQFEGEKPLRTGGIQKGGTGVPPVTPEGGSTPPSGVKSAGTPTTEQLKRRHRNLPHWEMGGSMYFITFRLKQGEFTESERAIVMDACRHWHGERLHLHLGVVMPDHVHLLMRPLERDGGWWALSELLHSIKSFSAHEIQKVRGTSGALWQDESFDRIVRDEEEFHEKWNYMINNPVEAGLVEWPEEYAFVVQPEVSGEPDAEHGRPRVELRPAVTGGTPVPPTESRPGDGELSFFPPRYAKMYQSWHENLRDWCISRQLWWGHRIPVWSVATEGLVLPEDFAMRATEFISEGRLAAGHGVSADEVQRRRLESGLDAPELPPLTYCIRDESDAEVVHWLRLIGFSQDPDVLDTWFSSGLWPLSTMGWPTPSDGGTGVPPVTPDAASTAASGVEQRATSPRRTASSDIESDNAVTGGTPVPPTLLDTFNPTSVLCTGRDIITLWVSRMVMFNRYFNDGKVPYRHVYINPMIQDGHGQRMSKSLGNGVDPRDIIHSHGADAMRFTLVDMATTTQDVRMPVDMVCPHCETSFTPKHVTSPAGYTVAAPKQSCPKCGKGMISGYGAASGEVTASDDAPLARNTSSKFDYGRNFCNKLWNAVRFAVSNLSDEPAAVADLSDLTLVDRWIITRMHRTLHTVEDAVRDYQFSVYADAMYTFVWSEFCDWYLEAIKPTVKSNELQQQVLRTVTDAILRMLHPIVPFVTEQLWPAVRETGASGIEGIRLPVNQEDSAGETPAVPSALLAGAAWPDIKCGVDDKDADITFARVRDLVESIRRIRAERDVPPKRQITLHATDAVMDLIGQAGGVVETMAGLHTVEFLKGDRPDNPTPFTFEGGELLLTDLVDALDAGKERERLEKLIADVEKAIAGFEGRLSNDKYVNRAPAHLVQETRDQLAAAETELITARRALDSLFDA